MRAAITDSGLPAKYWSDALIHSVFIKNCLPHAAFKHNSTPYTELTGTRPNMESLRIFGSPITTRKPAVDQLNSTIIAIMVSFYVLQKHSKT